MNNVRVYANDVDVGTLPTDKYKAICAEVSRDWRLYLAQGLNCGYVAFRMMCSLILAIPILIFWLFILVALQDPAGFTEILNGLVRDPAGFAYDFLRFAMFAILIAVPVIVISFGMFGKRIGLACGFINVFDMAINKSLRKILKIAGDCDLSVVEDVLINAKD